MARAAVAPARAAVVPFPRLPRPLAVPRSCNACSLDSHPITHSILIPVPLFATTEEEIIEFPFISSKKLSHFSAIGMVVEAPWGEIRLAGRK